MRQFLLFSIAFFMGGLAFAQWKPLGNAGFSAGEASYTSIRFSNGLPYVAYKDESNGGKALLKKLNN